MQENSKNKNMMPDDLILDVVKATLMSFVKIFQNNPFDFLYETDIQASIYSKLFYEFSLLRQSKPMTGEKWIEEHYRDGSFVTTNIVKTEYPSGIRFDIAVLDPGLQYVKCTPQMSNDMFWSQPVLIAIELKYCMLGDNANSKKNSCLSDLEKLKRYQADHPQPDRFCGLAVLFIMSYNENCRRHFDESKIKSMELSFGTQLWVVGPKDAFSCELT